MDWERVLFQEYLVILQLEMQEVLLAALHCRHKPLQILHRGPVHRLHLPGTEQRLTIAQSPIHSMLSQQARSLSTECQAPEALYSGWAIVALCMHHFGLRLHLHRQCKGLGLTLVFTISS